MGAAFVMTSHQCRLIIDSVIPPASCSAPEADIGRAVVVLRDGRILRRQGDGHET